MKLPVPHLLHKKPQVEHYLALLLHHEKAAAVILEEVDKKLRIIGIHEEYFITSIEDSPVTELLEVLDKAISRAEEALPPNVETQKTVFGVKAEWTEEKKIKKEYLGKLKKLSDELTLSPIGFLVISEAFAHLIQEEEGAPTTAIITEIGKTLVTISVFKAGRLIETHRGAVVESIPKTVDTLLKHVTLTEVLPARIILFNEGKDDSLVQEFITYQWSKSLSFLHMPQIAILPSGFDAKAVVFGAATQMGFQVLGTTAADDIKVVTVDEKKKETAALDAFSEKDILTPAIMEPVESSPSLTKDDEIAPIGRDGDNFGFVMDEDITKRMTEPKAAVEESPKTSELPEAQVAGPKIHHASSEEDASHSFGFKDSDTLYAVEEPFSHSTHEETDEKPRKMLNPLAPFTGIIALLMKPFKTMTKLSLLSGNKLILLIPVILIGLLALYGVYLFKVQATATLMLTQKVAQQQENITFSTSGQNDIANHVIAAKEITADVDGSSSAPATGKKSTGTPAKGSVTLYSRLTSSKTIPSGTVISGPNSVQFTLDKDVNLASASADASSGPTTASISVTAKDIGIESNLPSASKFSVSGYDSDQLVAKNDSAFSGGTKKDITAVSKDDEAKLVQALKTSLEDKAKAALTQKLVSGEHLLPIFTDESISTPKYDKQVGDEASTVTLTGTITYTSLAYSDDDLKQFSESILQSKSDSSQTISGTTLQQDISDAKQKDSSNVTASINLKAGLLPKIDIEQTRKEITGKTITDATALLMKLPQVSDVTFQFTPHIPFLTRRLPRFTDHVHLVIKS